MHRHSAKRRRFVMLIAAVTPSGLNAWSAATVRNYIGPTTSDWNTAANWSPSGVPVGGTSNTTAGDTVNIVNTGIRPASINVTLDANYGTNNPLGPLDIDGTGLVNDTLTIPANALSVYGNEIVGLNGSGNVVQTGGTASVGIVGSLYLARNNNSTGTYTLNNTTSASTLSVGGNEYDGYLGSAAFTQNNSTHTVGTGAANGNLYLGYSSNSIAQYNLGGISSLVVSGNEYVGESSAGTIIQGNLITQYGSTFNQSGGTNYVTGNFTLADNAGSTGSYTLGTSNSATLSVGGNEIIGNNGIASFVQNSGQNGIVSGGLIVGSSSTSSTYILNGGVLNTAGTVGDGSTEVVGLAATGTFIQTGGTNNAGGSSPTVNEPLTIGDQIITYDENNNEIIENGTGTYILNSDSGPSVLNADTEDIGFSQGIFNLSNQTVSRYGGTFIQSSGTNNARLLYLANNTLSTGLYNLTGGTLSVSLYEGIGFEGCFLGMFIQAGGTNIVGTTSSEGELAIGELGGTGVYDLSGSSAVLTVNGVLGIDDGVFNMSAGTAVITDNVDVADDGILLLSGGSLTVGGLSLPFDKAFTWTAGTLHVTHSSFQVPGYLGLSSSMKLVTDGGLNIATDAELDVSGGSLTVSAGSTASNQGVFNQSSGLVTVNGAFVNSGTAIFSGNQSWGASSVFVNLAGAATFASELSPTGFGPAVVVTGGSVTMPAVQQLTGLSIGTGAMVKSAVAGMDHATITQGLTFAGTFNAWSGTLDLGHNDFVIQQGEFTQITNQVKQGFNNGNWNGTGITSSTAAADTMHITALGVILNNQGGTALFNQNHLFDGVAPGPNDVLVKYTYFGDANLDGIVDGSDYSRIDNGYLAHLSGWFNGDFNYDGTINGSDYTLIDNAFNRQGAAITSLVADPSADTTAQVARNSSVPEPTSLVLVVAAATASLRRRKQPTYRLPALAGLS